MNATGKPSPHGEVDEVPRTDGRSFAHHVVMLIDVEDELRTSNDALLDGIVPELQGFLVMVKNGIHGSAGPAE
jgi:hypothetical protein